MEKDSRILVTGYTGLVGSALVRKLKKEGYFKILVVDSHISDLKSYENTFDYWRETQPEYVFNCAALVGGIHGNDTRSADFIRDNVLIQTNVIDVSHKFKVKKLLFLGSTCIYPKDCPQPIREEYLLSGALEETNKGYAVAKIAGITMCQMYHKQYRDNFISVMPTNIYGINDNFSLSGSHVLPALLRKFHHAKTTNEPTMEVWGTGKPRREFMYSDDLADALIFLMQNYDSSEIINVGTGSDISIRELAMLIREIVGFKGEIIWNSSYPDGTALRSIDITKLSHLGWKSKISLEDGIRETYRWYLANYPNVRL